MGVKSDVLVEEHVNFILLLGKLHVKHMLIPTSNNQEKKTILFNGNL